MMIQRIANVLNKHNKWMEHDVTGWKLVECICIAAVVGLGTGVCIAHRSEKKARKDSTITIEVQEIGKMRVGTHVKKPI